MNTYDTIKIISPYASEDKRKVNAILYCLNMSLLYKCFYLQHVNKTNQILNEGVKTPC